MPRIQVAGATAKSPSTTPGTRPTRQKKSRKIFDPADHELPPSKRQKRCQSPEFEYPRDSPQQKPTTTIHGSNNNMMHMNRSGNGKNICKICGTGVNNKQMIMLTCSDCSKTAHSKCMDYRYSDELARRLASMSSWQCGLCKSCSECNETNDDMLFCDSCDLGYHMTCHRPPLFEKQEGPWYCYRCSSTTNGLTNKLRKNFVQGISKQSGSSQSSCGSSSESSDILIAQFSSLLPPQRDVVMSHDATTKVPDVFDWTSQQITDYFRQLGFPAELCRVFIEQEIDGSALILMEREDIISNLGLRLGPALKMYEHARKLKTRYSLAKQF